MAAVIFEVNEKYGNEVWLIAMIKSLKKPFYYLRNALREVEKTAISYKCSKWNEEM